MHVLCPSCAAEYQIPELQRPRKLRCARCATEWRVMPPAAPEPPPPLAELDAGFEDPAPAGADAPAAPASPDAPAISLSPLAPLQADAPISKLAPRRPVEREAAVWAVLWALSLVLVGVALFAVWHWRGPIGHGWPPSLRLFRLLPGGA